MAKQHIFFGSALGLCLSLSLVYAPDALANKTNWQDADLSQGDGDPLEELPEELISEEKKSDATQEISEDDVATITAEGDFLLPTFLLPVEETAETSQLTASVETKETPSQVTATQQTTQTQNADTQVIDETVTTRTITTTTTTTTTEDLPIYVVSTQPTTKTVVQPTPQETQNVKETDQKTSPQSDTSVEIAQADKVATPQKVALPKTSLTQTTAPSYPIDDKTSSADLPVVLATTSTQNVKLPQTQTTQTTVKTTQVTTTPAVQSVVPQPTPIVQSGKNIETKNTAILTPVTPTYTAPSTRPILIPLAPLPKVAEPEPTAPTPPVRKVIPSEYADYMLTALEKNERPGFIMPQEIKVSFYKNASHFSGQTIKWIKAFSMKALNDPRLVVQVRLSTQNPAVQQKRLSIIKNTLIGNGLSPHQIQIVFTDRPTDSLVLRTINKPEHTQISVRKSQSGRRVEKRTTKW